MVDVIIVNNWGDNPNPRVHFLMQFLNINDIETTMIGRKNSIIPRNDKTILLNVPFNKDCAFLDSTFTHAVVRFIIIFYSTFRVLVDKPRFIYVRDIYFSIYFQFLSKIIGFKIIFESHGITSKEMLYKEKFFKTKWIGMLEQYNYQNSDYLVSITDTLKNNLSAYKSKEKIFLIPNGININEIRKVQEKYNTTHHSFDKKSTHFVGFVGNWEKWIEIEDLLEASRYLDPSIRTVIIGEGSNYSAYKSTYKNIIFTGKLSKKLVLVFLNRFDICISPWSVDAMFAEKSARKTFEYLAFGKPIIVSNTAGKESFLVTNENCITYEPKNPEDLSRKISQLLENPDLIRKLSHNNSKLAREFSWEKIFKNSKITDIFSQ